MGVSAFHGSELAVGWQWYKRLKEHENIIVLTHVCFDDPRFIPTECRVDFHFMGALLSDINNINRHHVFYSYCFWGAVIKHLQKNLKPEDRVVIVSPAALWFLPLIFGRNLSRSQFSYGPVGAELVNISDCGTGSLRAVMWARNQITNGLAITWRCLQNRLPKRISFRSRSAAEIKIGRSFENMGYAPEVELAVNTSLDADDSFFKPRSVTPPLLVLLDARARKNILGTLQLCKKVASAEKLEIHLLGDRKLFDAFFPLFNSTQVPTYLPWMDRANFHKYLSDQRPTILSLSLSEGVPSLFLDALSRGCEVRCLNVGGISWLCDSASSVTNQAYGQHSVVSIRWDGESIQRFSSLSKNRLVELAKVLI